MCKRLDGYHADHPVVRGQRHDRQHPTDSYRSRIRLGRGVGCPSKARCDPRSALHAIEQRVLYGRGGASDHAGSEAQAEAFERSAHCERVIACRPAVRRRGRHRGDCSRTVSAVKRVNVGTLASGPFRPGIDNRGARRRCPLSDDVQPLALSNAEDLR